MIAGAARRLDRLPLRWKLTVTAAVASCLALAVGAALMLVTFRSGLLHGVRRDLRQNGEVIAAAIRRDGPAALDTPTIEARLSAQAAVAQILSPEDRVLAASASAPAAPLTNHGQPSASPVSLDHSDRAPVIQTVSIDPRRRLILARPLRDLDLADESLRIALLIGVPLILILVIGGAYLVSARALAPVERMRRRAAQIGAAGDGTRLPVPDTDDELAGLGRTLNDLLDRVAESAAHEHSLIANASHELRTPLARLRARLELALDPAHPLDPDRARATLAATERDVAGLAHLADDLLGLAALDERRPQPLEPIDLHELLARSVGARRAVAAAAGRTIEADVEPIVLVANPGMLGRAVDNLLDNALTHGRGAIVVRAHATAEHVEILVQDEGDGLDLPLDRATARFTRGAAAQGRPGAGLGLALVKAVADAHAGTLTQRGPALVLTLPARPGDPALTALSPAAP